MAIIYGSFTVARRRGAILFFEHKFRVKLNLSRKRGHDAIRRKTHFSETLSKAIE